MKVEVIVQRGFTDCNALGGSGFVKNHLEHFVYKKSTLGNC